MKLLSIFKTEVIEFFCHPDLAGIIPEPTPAFKNIPQWFKSLPLHTSDRDNFGAKSMTAKKCMPLLDAMSLGYTIPLAADLHVISNSDLTEVQLIEPQAGMHIAEYHSREQVGNITPSSPIKFINPWVVRTAPGWSTLFIPPINNINSDFTPLSGLVDTDNYYKEVNFPAIWNTPNFDGKIPAGTPIVTAIPIKRNSFPEYPKVRDMSDEEFKSIGKMTAIQNNRASYYTKELRDKR